MNKLLPLIKREVQEHRTLIVYLPLVMILLCVTGIILSLFNLQQWGLESISLANYLVEEVAVGEPSFMVEVSGIEGVASLPFETREVLFGQMLSFLTLPFQAVLFGFMVYYFIQSLFHERKDRSVLFWKSMPVSDRDTVISKLLTGMVIAPYVYLLCAMVLQLLLLIIVSVYALGFDVNIWSDLWQPSGLLSIWGVYLVVLPLAIIWILPTYSWFMLVSAKVKSIPFAWAIGIPFTLVLFEKILFHQSPRSDTATESFIASHLVTAEFIMPVYNYLPGEALKIIGDKVFSVEQLLLALLFSAVFICGAIWFRGKAGEI